jgi:hypothetical protein
MLETIFKGSVVITYRAPRWHGLKGSVCRLFIAQGSSRRSLPDESAEEMRPQGGRINAKHVLLALIVLGLAFRVTSLANRDLGFDANYYLTMGQTMLKHGEFYMPWGDPSNLNGVPQFSHHISPLFPAYLGMFYALFGSSYAISTVVRGLSSQRRYSPSTSS